MSEHKEPTPVLNVQLTPSDSSAHPRATNYSHVGMAQGIAYLDFGFIEPAVLASVAQTAKDGRVAPTRLDAHLVTRVTMDVIALARLYQQIQQVLVALQATQKPMAKGAA